MSLKQDLHDRMWRAFERWHEQRAQGETKHGLKMRGIRDHSDPNHYTRNLIFTGNTLRTYESVLKDFVALAPSAQRLEDLGKHEFRAFMDRGIEKGLAAKTLNKMRSALAKFGALTGQTRSFAALSEKYGQKIRELQKSGQLAGPQRATPSADVVQRAIAKLREWDARHFGRTDQARVYHLAAQLQLETSCRSISATTRVTAASVLDGHRIMIVGKGGKVQIFTISPDLHRRIVLYLSHTRGHLAAHRGYQSAYARAMRAVGGQVTGTHGMRRHAARNVFTRSYRDAVGSGLSPHDASRRAAGDAIQRLGHSRHRQDHRRAYMGR